MKAFKHDSATIDPMTNYWPTSTDLNVYNLKYIVQAYQSKFWVSNIFYQTLKSMLTSQNKPQILKVYIIDAYT